MGDADPVALVRGALPDAAAQASRLSQTAIGFFRLGR